MYTLIYGRHLYADPLRIYSIFLHGLYKDDLPTTTGAAVLYIHTTVSNHSDIDAVWTNVTQVRLFTLMLQQEHMASVSGGGA